MLALEVEMASHKAYEACGEKTHLLDDLPYITSAVEAAKKLITTNLSPVTRLRMLCDLCPEMRGIERSAVSQSIIYYISVYPHMLIDRGAQMV